MTDEDETRLYRKIIDELVHACRAGQGHLQGSGAGVELPKNRKREFETELAARWDLTSRLSQPGDVVLTAADREVLAIMLQGAFESGVHCTLGQLHWHKVKPFEKAYEGLPFNDFIGRLDGWEWPVNEVEPRFE